MGCLGAAGERRAAIEHPSCAVLADEHETQQRSAHGGCELCVADSEPAGFCAVAAGDVRCRLRASVDQASVFLAFFAASRGRFGRHQSEQYTRVGAACECIQLWRWRGNEQCGDRVPGTVDPFLPCVAADLELNDLHGQCFDPQRSFAICFREQ